MNVPRKALNHETKSFPDIKQCFLLYEMRTRNDTSPKENELLRLPGILQSHCGHTYIAFYRKKLHGSPQKAAFTAGRRGLYTFSVSVKFLPFLLASS